MLQYRGMHSFLESLGFALYRTFGITPNQLSYFRLFAAPWLALMIGAVTLSPSYSLFWITLTVYLLCIFTDSLDGPLARTLLQKNISLPNASIGPMLDRLSDKLVIILLLIPFGFNLFTASIILGESILAYQAITAPANKKGALLPGKIKMVLQSVLIPLLLATAVFSSAFLDTLATSILFSATFFTFLSLYAHYKN